MKKIILFLSILPLCMSCSLRTPDMEISRSWCFRNYTGQILILKCPYSESLTPDDFEYREFEIAHGASAIIGQTKMNLREGTIEFDDYFRKSAEALGEDVSWQIFSKDGVLLKTWKYSDRDLPEQIFFERKRWRQSFAEFIAISRSWNFDLRYEDIGLISQ